MEEPESAQVRHRLFKWLLSLRADTKPRPGLVRLQMYGRLSTLVLVSSKQLMLLPYLSHL